MHEVGVMQETLDIALRRAAEDGACRIHRLTMRIGPLSGVVPEALALAFEVVTQGTIAEGATLEVEDVPIICSCAACDLTFHAGDVFCECPRCARPSAEVRQGRELELASLEVS